MRALVFPLDRRFRNSDNVLVSRSLASATMPSRSVSHVAGERSCLPEIRKKWMRVNRGFLGVLDEEVPEAQVVGVLEDLPKFIPGHPAVQRGTRGELANGHVLAHQADGELPSELHKDHTQRLQGILHVTRQDKVPDQDPASG